MQSKSFPPGGARALFAALAAAESDEASLARFAALLAGADADESAIDRVRRAVHPPPPAPRPPCSLVIRGGDCVAPREWSEPLARARPALACVGRLESVKSDHVTIEGTAWMVRPDIAVTNRHSVAHLLFALGRGERTLQIDLRGEIEAPTTNIAAVREVLYIAPDHDLAFLRVAPQPACVTLATRAVRDHDLALIGFPGADRHDQPDRHDARFGDGFAVKRVAPGRLAEVSATALDHDCTRLPGGAGSLLLDLALGTALGLELAGGCLPAWIVHERLERLAP